MNETLAMTVANIISLLIRIYTWMIIIYILMSWIPNARSSQFGIFLEEICEPFLAPFRKLIPPIGGMLDLSPIIAIIALNLAQTGVYAIASFF